MSENVSPKTPESFLQREDWLVLLTGGLVSSSAIGWLLYSDFKSPQLNYRPIMTIAACFAGGMGVYFTGSALVNKWLKPNESQGNLVTSKQDVSDLTALDRETSLFEMFANLVIEFEKKFVSEASARKVLDEIITNEVQEAAEVPGNSEDMTKRPNYLNRKVPRKGLKLSIDKPIELCSNGGIGNESQGNLVTSKQDVSNLNALDRETSLFEMFANLVIELEKKFVSEVSAREVLDEIITNEVQEAAEVPCNSEDMTKRPNYLNRKVPRKGLKLSIDKPIELCSNEGIGSRKARFKEEILSYVNELKGYVQGTIDPLPLARNIQFRSFKTSDEMRRQIIMIVKEYVDSISPKLEKVIDDFMDSVCKGVNVLDCDKEHKVKKAFETLGVSENGLSSAPLKNEMKQYYNALEDATKNKSRMPSCQNGQRSKNALRPNRQRLESISGPKLNERNNRVKTSECSLPVMPNLESPNSAGIPFKSKEANKPAPRTVEKLKNPQSDPLVKLSLTQEQMNYLKILKSEI